MHNNVNAQQYQITSRHMHSIRFAWRRCRSTSHLQTSLCAMLNAQCQPRTFLGQRTTNELHTVFALFRIKVLIVMANEFRVDFFFPLFSCERAHVVQHCHNMCSVQCAHQHPMTINHGYALHTLVRCSMAGWRHTEKFYRCH